MQLQAREEFEEEISDEEDMANCLILLARGSSNPTDDSHRCKTCNKSFPSFQALGGHRASHKRPNKPPSARLSTVDRKTLEFQSKGPDDSKIANKSRVHECAICRAEFSSGQALGGHMRRHRPISIPIPIPTQIPNVPYEDDHESRETKRSRNDNFSLDLNLPAPDDDDDCAESDEFPFVQKEQAMIFSLSPLVDCRY